MSSIIAVLSAIIFYFVFIMAIVMIAVKSSKRKKALRSSDGHIVSQKEDLTCETKANHKHPKSNEFGERYIVHNEPSLGYVTLNGVLRKIEDCKDL